MGSTVAAGMLLLPTCTSEIVEKTPYLFFTKEEGKCVMALCEQLIPKDDQFGGATDAGVINYIDRHLSETFREEAPIYRDNLKQLQDTTDFLFGKHFEDLNSEEQIDFIQRMASNQIDQDLWKNPSTFFRLIRSHAMQGYYGASIHGGNNDNLSFDMLKLGPPLNPG